MSRSALRPTQPFVQWVPETLSPVIKRPGHELNHSPQLVLRLRMGGATLLPALHKKCTNPRCQVTWATKYCTVAPYICWSSVQNLRNPSGTYILRWPLNICKMCVGTFIMGLHSLIYGSMKRIVTPSWEVYTDKKTAMNTLSGQKQKRGTT
jgi:hypothetical protein